ncbi:MAG: hypothetical protein QOK36_2307 [Gaiellales bacterium]|nr:hypothetical protein [Gaiellales bacterium]
MDGIEGLGSFYLGKPYDPDTKSLTDGYVLYDSKDLTTHAVCVGMTGSGKTGLCVDVIEEAALDGVPAIVIDPKGDLADLMLTFPALRPEDFRPWINEDDAGKAGVSPDAYAKSQAELWAKGLADWGQDGARIQRLRDAADFAIYTPGSDAGLPVSVLGSFAPPADRSDAEAVGDQIGAIATGLLALLGIDADPIKSREHILISSILGAAWANGQALDIAALIAQIQQPPFRGIGVLDLDSFYPQKERFQLALALNNLLAAPGFQLWMQGVPLDVGQLLRTDAGKPRVAIFSIAHLSDAERMFFVTLLLNAVLAWMRGQSGTTSLRALVYMDEIFGYFPPNGEPPSKKPLLTLLKQARAFGLGILLATQNPVDLDYKGLSNAGTWLIGRLQTDQDKQRVLDGLEGASGQGGLDRGQLEKLISALGNRVFLLNNVHENAPEVFQTRWTMSYLRGPLSRPQIASLMAPLKRAMPAPAAAPATAPAAASPVQAPAPAVSAAAATQPAAPSGISPAYLPLRGVAPAGATLVYVPMLIGSARVRLLDTKAQVDSSSENARLASFASGPIAVDWNAAADLAVAAADLESTPREGASFVELPAPARDAKSYTRWSKDYADWLYQTQTVQLFRSPSQKLVSRSGESEADFRARLAQGAREGRDTKAEALRAKYETKVASLQSKLHTAEQAVDREKNQEHGAGLQAAVSVAGSILGGFLGRKSVSVGSITSVARGAGRVAQQHDDVARARENVKLLESQIAELQASFAQDAAGVGDGGAATEQLDSIVIRPKKADIDVTLVTLAFAPHWQDAGGQLTPAY